MACKQCEHLDKVEIECVRRLDAAHARLHTFFPEPPYGEAAANELKSYQNAVEEARTGLANAKRERAAHCGTHAMTLTS